MIRKPDNFVATTALALALGGCFVARPPDAEVIAPVTPHGALAIYDATGRINQLGPRATILGTDKPNARGAQEILVLSGGGSNGAFGAGVMSGWTESGKRPVFDVVTGISTGALIAPFAFLGPAYDAELAALYTHINNDAVYRSRGPLGLLDESLNDTSPLRAQLEAVMSDTMVDAIAAAHRSGRRLYVGTTDLDLGEAVVWDVGGIAAEGKPDRRARIVSILLASAAVPGMFNPVFIDSADGRGAHLHVDGGVKAPLLLRDFMLDGNARSKHVYFVVNSCMCLRNVRDPVTPSFVSVSKKSIEELLRSSLYRTLQTGVIMTRNAGAKPSVVFIPDEVTAPDPMNFDSAEMKMLFDVGRSVARHPESWRGDAPRMQRFL